MMIDRWTCWAVTAIAVAGLVVTGVSTCGAAESSLSAAPGAVEVAEPLLRGPLHEAFAEPVQMDPQPATIVPKQPPEPIEELPPEAKPVDEDVIWIPGYWAWDEEREDFIYVSGVWRVPPQGRRWVPGYWTPAGGGYQWVSGFWAPIEVEEVQYLPDPPESLESGPNSPSPSSEHYWVSGNWCYRDDRYAWRPGYWNTFREGWVWVPSHYVWTPQGVVFIDGYWDCPLSRRGVVFAPVWFSQPAYLSRAFYYTPSVVIDVSHLLMHLFVHPRRGHYYWGDYYDFHARRGQHFYPCFDYHGRHGYDPVFAYYDAFHRHRHIDYTQRLRGWHDYFRQHKEYRPPHTLHAQAQLAARVKHHADLKYAMLGSRLDDVLSGRGQLPGRGGPAHFERITPTHRQAWIDAAKQTRELTHRRIDVETGHRRDLEARHKLPASMEGPPKIGGKPDASKPPMKLRLPDLPRVAGSPVARAAPERLDKPKSVERLEVPKIERGGFGSERTRTDWGTLRDQPKPPERDAARPTIRSLPDVSQPRPGGATPSRRETPRIETRRIETPQIWTPRIEASKTGATKTETFHSGTARVPEFRRPELGSVRQSPSARNVNQDAPTVANPRSVPSLDRAPSVKLPDREATVRTLPTPGRTPSVRLPDRQPSLQTAPSLDRAPSFKLPDRGTTVRTLPTPGRTPSVTLPDRQPSPRTAPSLNRASSFKLPDRNFSPYRTSPRIESPSAARHEVLRPPVSVPKFPSATASPSRNLPSRSLPSVQSRSSVPRPEFKSREASGSRSAPSRVDHGPPGGRPGSGKKR